MHREIGGVSFVEGFLPEGIGRNESLERIDQAVDWDKLSRLVNGIHSSSEGRKSYPPLMMVRVMLLQQWYGASDPAMEEALSDRLSFRRFVGLGIQDESPDHSTISRFRRSLTERGLGEELLEELNRQLDGKGLMVKSGTLMDATLVESQGSRKSGSAEGTDKDAAWTRKGSRSHYGYKMHIGVDEGSGLIRKAVLTPANVNDTEVADELILGDELAVYADRAYDTHRRRQRLKSMGIQDQIMRRANKHHPEVADVESASEGGEGVRYAEAVIRLQSGALHRS